MNLLTPWVPRANLTKRRRTSLSVKLHFAPLGKTLAENFVTSAYLFSGPQHRESRRLVADKSWFSRRVLGNRERVFGEFVTVRRLRPLTAAPGPAQRLRNLKTYLSQKLKTLGRLQTQRPLVSSTLDSPSKTVTAELPAREPASCSVSSVACSRESS